MGKPLRKRTARLKRRQATFAATKNKQGQKLPGSMNAHKSASTKRSR